MRAWPALAAEPGLVLLAGRYEGVDERLLEKEIDLEISIGDFVVSGGELPALLLIDAIVRQLPGVLNDAQSNVEESFVDGLLDCPHYTRPNSSRGGAVPAVLLSGNHAEIARWRRKQSLGRTWLRRPDLLAEKRCRRKMRSCSRNSSARAVKDRQGVTADRRQPAGSGVSITNRAHQVATCSVRQANGRNTIERSNA